MNLRELRSFVAVARTGSFSRAAETLYLGQPAVSQHVRRLEAELGLALFARTTRAVVLTDAGQAFLPRVQRALAELDGGVAEIDEVRGLLRGHLRIGAMQWLDPYDLPQALAAFRERHPDIEITVVEEPTTVMVAAVLDGSLDAAYVPLESQAGVSAHELFTDDLVLIVGRDSPLAGRSGVRFGALRDASFVFLREGSGLRRSIEDAARAAGYTPRVGLETNELARVFALVAAGLGVSVVSRTVAQRAHADVALVPLRPAPRRTVGLVWRAERRQPPAARAFIDHVRAGGAR